MKFSIRHLLEAMFWVGLLLCLRQPIFDFIYWLAWSWEPRAEYEARHLGFCEYSIWILCWFELLSWRFMCANWDGAPRW